MAATTHAPHHRAALDGIRTIAVYLVVAFHAGSALVGGGFIGVDVFFVLSGYLVTQVLLRDLDGPGGRVGFGRFYARRVRRLLPAAVLTVLVTAAVYGAVTSPSALVESAGGFRASLLYVANWFFIAESTNYFAADEASPVLHFWSLAVEEQFYVVWPLLLAGVWALAGRGGGVGRRRRARVAAVVAVLAAASFATAAILRFDAPSRAYLGTDTRAYQLLGGAFLALLPEIVRRTGNLRAGRVLGLLGVAGVLFVATSAFDQGPFARSAAATVATVVLIVGVEAHPGGFVGRALSIRPLVYLGTISYATYLWHWPVIVVARELGLVMSPASLAVLAAALATGLAALSSELLELPIRRSPGLDRHRYVVIMAGVGASLVAAFVLLPPLVAPERAIRTTTASDTPAAPVGGRTPIPTSFSFDEVYDDAFGDDLTVDCTDGPVSGCTVVEGAGTHVLLVGDSNAVMYVPALVELARTTDLRLSLAAIAGCPWQLDVVGAGGQWAERCRDRRPATYERLVPELAPDVIILVNATLPDGEGDGSSDAARELRAATDASLDRLIDTGATIVIVRPAPATGFASPLDCLASAAYAEQCAFTYEPEASWLDDELQRRAAASPQVHFVDLGPTICPRLPTCDAMLDDVPTYWDQGHITRRYSTELADDIGRELAARGIIPAAPTPTDD